MIDRENPSGNRHPDPDSDDEPETDGSGAAAPGWTVYLQIIGKILMYLGGASFVGVACLWAAIKAGFITEFDYLALAFPTAGVYFGGRIMNYVGRLFAKPEDKDEIVYRRPGHKHDRN